MTLALPVAATPWQVPSPREAGLLADAFAGAALGLVLGSRDGCRCWRRWVSRSPTSGCARWRSTAVLAIENDAVGIEAGYLPGLGERDARVAALVRRSRVPRIVTGGPDATDAEVAASPARGASQRRGVQKQGNFVLAGADAAATFFLRSAGAVC